MKAKDLLEVHACHDQLASGVKGFSRVAAYRIQRNLAQLLSLVQTQQEAFRKTVEAAKAEHNGNGETPEAVMDKIRADVWKAIENEDIEVSLRKIPADGIPWENVAPVLGVCLNRFDLVEGEPEMPSVSAAG